MFEAKVAAIHHCNREVERWADLDKSVAIFSDSQAALCYNFASVDLNELDSQKKLRGLTKPLNARETRRPTS